MQVGGASAAAAAAQGPGFAFAPAARPSPAVQALLDYAKETPAQKMRDQILGTMGLTEEKLRGLPPKERAKIEAKIREIIKEKVEQSTEKKTGQIVDLKA
jgi:hypothetical protein